MAWNYSSVNLRRSQAIVNDRGHLVCIITDNENELITRASTY